MCNQKEKLELQKQLTEIKLKLCQLEEQSSIKPITPNELIQLAQYGKLTEQQLQTYLQNGGDINYQDNDGWTALMAASWQGYLEIVKLLVEKGAKLDIENDYGSTSLRIAYENGYLYIVKYLKQKTIECYQSKINEVNKY